jgi:TPR repeat protein
LRDWLAAFLCGVGVQALTEQVVPAWYDEAAAHGHAEARLDVMCYDLRGRKTYVDVRFALADSKNAATLSARASTDGSAAAERVARKRRRYPADRCPGASLVPFVMEAHGRPSPEATAFLKAMVPFDFPDRTDVLARARRDLSVLTQTRLADLLLSAEAPSAA